MVAGETEGAVFAMIYSRRRKKAFWIWGGGGKASTDPHVQNDITSVGE